MCVCVCVSVCVCLCVCVIVCGSSLPCSVDETEIQALEIKRKPLVASYTVLFKMSSATI